MQFCENILINFKQYAYINNQRESLSSEEKHLIYKLRLICSSISILGCLFIITSYFIMCFRHRCKSSKRNYTISSSGDTNENENSRVSFSDSYAENRQLNISSNINTTNGLVRSPKNRPLLMKKQTIKINPKKEKKMGLGNDLIFFLICTNLFWCIGSFLSIEPFEDPILDKENPACIAQAFVQNYFDMASICWNAIISRLTLLGTVTTYSTLRNMRKKMYLLFLYSNLFPFILSLGPYLSDSYGSSGVWCWIDINNMDTYTIIWVLLFYIFNWGHIFYIIYALIATSKYFAKRKKEIGNDLMKLKEAKFLGKYIFFLKIFPLILVLTRITGTLNRTYNMIAGNDSYFLYCLGAVAYSLSGFFNALLYSYFYRSVFSCCHKRKSEVTENLNYETKNLSYDNSL